jgi:hypothetical protein
MFNGILGVGFFLSTFFVSGVWGFSVWFQPLTTAAAHLGLTFVLNSWLKNPNTDRVDILGAFLIALNGMLLQTAILFGGLGGNIAQPAIPGSGQSQPCVVFGGSGDRATSAFAWILFVTNMGFGIAAYSWRNDYLRGQAGLGGYSSIPTSGSGSGGGGVGNVTSAPLTQALHPSGLNSSRLGGGGGKTTGRNTNTSGDDNRDGFLDDSEGGL